MANFTLSPNMSLPVPTVGVDPGPDWANNINSSLTLLDLHNHAPGAGVQINPSGLNINSDLTFNGNNLTLARSVRFQSQSAALAAGTDVGCLYEVAADLYYNDGSGNQIRLTQSGSIAGTSGSIANLTSPASATYVSGSSTFVWQSAANTPANMDGGSFIFRNISASSFGLTVSAPASLSADYSIVWPSLPSVTALLTMDTSGNIGSTYTSDTVGLNMTSTGANAVANTRTRTTSTSTVGIGGVALSPSCGSFVTTSTSFVDVTNLSVTITTSGRPVMIVLRPDGTVDSQSIGLSANISLTSGIFITLNILRDSTTIVRNFYSIANGTGSISSQFALSFNSLTTQIDPVPAGTYTYKVQIRSISNVTASIQSASLCAFEL